MLFKTVRTGVRLECEVEILILKTLTAGKKQSFIIMVVCVSMLVLVPESNSGVHPKSLLEVCLFREEWVAVCSDRLTDKRTMLFKVSVIC